MIGKVDAVLLARDDAERHLEMSKSFIEAGIPIFIDKPLALSLKEAMQMLDLEKYTGQVFSCSSLLYANEYDKSKLNHDKVGNLTFSEAIVPKKWTTYSVHIIEPLLNLIGNQGKITKVTNTGKGEINIVTVHWESGHVSLFKTTGSTVSPLKLTIYGDKGFQEFTFQDSFSAFKKSLEIFVESIRKKSCPIPRENTMRVIEIIEKGNIK
jgi:predicted dehydrogenase